MQAKFGKVVAVVVVVSPGLIQDYNETLEKDGQDYLGNTLCIQLCCYLVIKQRTSNLVHLAGIIWLTLPCKTVL